MNPSHLHCQVAFRFCSLFASFRRFDFHHRQLPYATLPPPITAVRHASTINIYRTPCPCQVVHRSPSFFPCAFLSLQDRGLSSPVSSRTLNFDLTVWTNYIKANPQLLWKAPLSLPLQLLSVSTPIHPLSFFQCDRFPSVQHRQGYRAYRR